MKIADIGAQLHALGLAQGHRYFILISGSKEWCLGVAHALLQSYPPEDVQFVTRGTSDRFSTTQPNQSHKLLGSEFDAIIYDAHDGIGPDVIGVVSGTIRSGGLMLLMVPSLSKWITAQDTDYQKHAPFNDKTPSSNNYVGLLIQIFTQDPRCLLISEENESNVTNTLSFLTHQNTSYEKRDGRVFLDQNAAIEGIKKVVRGQRRRPAILISDRGRGKSAALGIAAGHLVNEGLNRIIITSHNRQSVDSFFKHAQTITASVNDKIMFVPLDELIRNQPTADLLLVDEAASTPMSGLTRLLKHYPRIAFASTVHGYEGTGRSFLLRFTDMLDQHTRGWKRYDLEEPIRWAKHDPLEGVLFRALMLDSAPPCIDAPSISQDLLIFEALDQATLAKNETTLRDVFGLLVTAHYRTRPSDLRHLLDAPNLRLFRLSFEGKTIAVAMVSLEGGLPSAVTDAIWMGETRPRGHLLPELLTAQLGHKNAGSLHFARIVRIVVHPAVQGNGIGTLFMKQVRDHLRSSVDIIGTSFGLNDKLLRFWVKSGFAVSRIGLSPSSHSGTHSCLLTQPNSPAGEQLTQSVLNQFQRNFPFHLTTILKDLDPQIIAYSYLTLNISNTLTDSEKNDLIPFADGERNPDNIPASLTRLCEISLRFDPSIALDGQISSAQTLAIQRIFQSKDWRQCTSLEGSDGKKEGVRRLRKWAKDTLEKRSLLD